MMYFKTLGVRAHQEAVGKLAEIKKVKNIT